MGKSKPKHIEIIGFPMDLGNDRRGVEMGPSAIRIANVIGKIKSLGHTVSDIGNIKMPDRENMKIGNEKLKFLQPIIEASESLAAHVINILERGNFPLCLGGDHTLALGTTAGAASFCKAHKKKLGIIWIDAHADMNTEETTPSGNIHGMPMAANLGLGNSLLRNIGGFEPKIKPENCALIGIRSLDLGEKKLIKEIGIPIYTMEDLDKRGVHEVVAEALERISSKVDHLHVSLDMDCVDPKEAPGVGTPIPGGLTYREVHTIMETIAESGKITSLGVAEVNPILDNSNQTAKLAVELIGSALGAQVL